MRIVNSILFHFLFSSFLLSRKKAVLPQAAPFFFMFRKFSASAHNEKPPMLRRLFVF
jgi:hypothetical protein